MGSDRRAQRVHQRAGRHNRLCGGGGGGRRGGGCHITHSVGGRRFGGSRGRGRGRGRSGGAKSKGGSRFVRTEREGRVRSTERLTAEGGDGESGRAKGGGGGGRVSGGRSGGGGGRCAEH